MNCPYCGYSKTVRKKDGFKTYTCPRCSYLFEASFGGYLLERILSVPFNSIIYTPIILTINYYIALATFQESLVSFGIFVAFHNLMTAFVLLFILFITSGRKSRIFLVKTGKKNNLITTINEINPLIKMVIFLFISAIVFPFFYR